MTMYEEVAEEMSYSVETVKRAVEAQFECYAEHIRTGEAEVIQMQYIGKLFVKPKVRLNMLKYLKKKECTSTKTLSKT